MDVEALGIEPDICKAIANRGMVDALDAYMIIFKDGVVAAVADDMELEQILTEAIELGKVADIAYVFCDGQQMDLQYHIEFELTPVDVQEDEVDEHFERDGDMETEMLDRETDRGLRVAMEVGDDGF